MKNLSKQFKVLFLLVINVLIGITYSCKSEEKKQFNDGNELDLSGLKLNINIDMTSKFKRTDVDANKLFAEIADEFYDTDLPEVNDANDSVSSFIGANITIENDSIAVFPFDNTIDVFPINENEEWDVYGVCETEDCFKQKMQEVAKLSEGKCMEVRVIRDKTNSKVYGITVPCN